MIKLVAGILILAGCGYLGILFAGQFKKRVKSLEEFQNALSQLEYDIDFSESTLCSSFEKISRTACREVGVIFLYMSDRLRKNPGADMKGLWSRAIDKYRDDIALKDEDVGILLDFSVMLGKGSREKEKNNIKLAKMRLQMAEEVARQERERNIKMYRGLGFLSGIFIVILLA